MQSVPDILAAVGEADVVIIVTNHKIYDYQAILHSAKFIFDTRNALGARGKNNPKVVRL
jgi:UDP-N-acetyl-D-glucosamine dehydrogenase